MMYVPDWIATGVGKLGLEWLHTRLSKPKRDQEQIQRLQSDLEAKTAKVAEYESFENLKEEFPFSEEEGVCRRKDGSGFYCPLCRDVDHRAVNLVHCGNGIFQCGVHKDFNYVSKSLHRRPRSFRPGRRY